MSARLLFTTESVDGSIQNVRTSGGRTFVTVRQTGQMPSPVVLKVELSPTGSRIKPAGTSRSGIATATFEFIEWLDPNTALVTYPADVWFAGSRTFVAGLAFGGRTITKITLDPNGRFPDHDASDNVWPRAAVPTKPTGRN